MCLGFSIGIAAVVILKDLHHRRILQKASKLRVIGTKENLNPSLTVAVCDQFIEEILAEHNEELELFVNCNNPRFRHVEALVDFERARRLSLIELTENQIVNRQS